MKAPACLFFPLKGNSLLSPGRGGVVTLPVMDGSSWPPAPLVHFHLSTNLPPNTRKVTSKRAWLASGPYARFVLDSSTYPNIPSPRPPRSKRQTNTVPALIELLGYLSSAGSPMAEHLGALFPGDLTSGKSTRPRKVGMPRSPQGADLSPSSKPPCCSPRLPS